MSKQKTIHALVNQYYRENGFGGCYDPKEPDCDCAVGSIDYTCANVHGCLPGYKHPDGSIRPEKPEHKRCPHCGGQPYEVVNSAFSCRVQCRDCLAQTRTCLDSAEAWKLWDSRVEATK